MTTSYYAYYNKDNDFICYTTTQNPTLNSTVYSEADVELDGQIVNLYAWSASSPYLLRWTLSQTPSSGDMVFEIDESGKLTTTSTVSSYNSTTQSIKITENPDAVLYRDNTYTKIIDNYNINILLNENNEIISSCKYSYNKSILSYIRNINGNIDNEVYNGAFQTWDIYEGSQLLTYYALVDEPMGAVSYPIINLVQKDNTTIAYLVSSGNGELFNDTIYYYGTVVEQTSNTIKIVRDNYPIGGSSFQGVFVPKNLTLLNNYTFPANTENTYDLSTYLPADGYAYEILFSLNIHTDATSGHTIGISYQTSLGYCRSQINTRANRDNLRYTTSWLGIPASDRLLTIKNDTNYSGRVYLKARGYRRLNSNNNPQTRYISAINDIDIGGAYYDGDFILVNKYITIGELAPSEGYTIDLSSILPDNESSYILYGDIIARSTGTTNNSTRLMLSSSIMPTGMDTCACKSLNANSTEQTSAFAIPVGYAVATNLQQERMKQCYLIISNEEFAVGTSGSIDIRLRFLRRIGINE